MTRASTTASLTLPAAAPGASFGPQDAAREYGKRMFLYYRQLQQREPARSQLSESEKWGAILDACCEFDSPQREEQFVVAVMSEARNGELKRNAA